MLFALKGLMTDLGIHGTSRKETFRFSHLLNSYLVVCSSLQGDSESSRSQLVKSINSLMEELISRDCTSSKLQGILQVNKSFSTVFEQ